MLCLFRTYGIAVFFVIFFCKQKTAYGMLISDWSSDLCSSDLTDRLASTLEAASRMSGDSVDSVREARMASNPSRRFGRPEEFGATCAFLCSKIGRASCRERVCQYV